MKPGCIDNVADDRILQAIREGNLKAVSELVDNGGLAAPSSDPSSLIGKHKSLCLAIEHNHMEIAKFLISKGAQVTTECESCPTPLVMAIRKNDVEMTELLLQSGACARVVGSVRHDRNPSYSLLQAVRFGQNVEIIKLLVKYGASVDASDYFEMTALAEAVFNHPKEIVELLLKRHVDISGDPYAEFQILFSAILQGDLDVLDLVLQYRPDVTHATNRLSFLWAVRELGSTDPFQRTNPAIEKRKQIDKNHENIIQALFDCGFSFIPGDRKNVMYDAVRGGKVEDVKRLLENSFYVCMVRGPLEGISPLHCASIFKHTETAKLLLTYGADVNAKDDNGARIPIYYAIQNNDIDMFNLLLTDVKEYPDYILSAVEKQDTAFMEGLLKHGADVNYVFVFSGEYHSRKTALYIACELNNVKMVNLLLDFNADVDFADSDGTTPLLLAARSRYLSICDALLQGGANVNADADGETALHVAAACHDPILVRLLLNYGADVNIAGSKKITPLDCVIQNPDLDSIYQECVCPSLDFCFTFDYLIKHIAKLKAARFYVSLANLKYLEPQNIALYCREKKGGSPTQMSFDFLSRCKREILVMKTARISNNCKFSFYDVLTSSDRQMLGMARNECLANAMSSGLHLVHFPIYASMIECKYRFGKRRFEAEKDSWQVFFSKCFPVPDICFYKIFGYLSDLDVKRVILAGQLNVSNDKI